MSLIPDQVTTLEYATVGYAFQSSGHMPEAEELYRLGLKVAHRPLDRVVALRSIANVRFLVDDAVGGRDFYTQARAVYSKELDAPAIVVFAVNAETELRWGSAELLIGECDEAAAHVDEAEVLAANLFVNNFGPLIAQARAQLAQCHPGSPPPSPPVLPPAS